MLATSWRTRIFLAWVGSSFTLALAGCCHIRDTSRPLILLHVSPTDTKLTPTPLSERK